MGRSPVSGHQIVEIGGRRFVLRLALVLSTDLHAGYPPEIVARIFSLTIDEQVLLLVHEVLPRVFGHFKVRRELDGVRRTRLFAVTAENAPGEVDAEKLGIAPPVRVFGGLQRDAVHGTGNGAEVARHAPLAAV